MWHLDKRWFYLLNKLPARKRLRALEKDYWHLYDEWAGLENRHKLLYDRYMDLTKEVMDWERRHSKVLNFVEKEMEKSDG